MLYSGLSSRIVHEAELLDSCFCSASAALAQCLSVSWAAAAETNLGWPHTQSETGC